MRTIAVAFFLEGTYLLVPWQSLAYKRGPFESCDNLVIWMGVPLMYLAARAAWTSRLRPREIALFATLNWL